MNTAIHTPTHGPIHTAIRVGIGIDPGFAWHEKFAQALDAQRSCGVPLSYEILNLERHDWIEQIMPLDLIIWKPPYMGPKTAAHFKEKIYFVERYLGKRIIPNYNTVWHFESKVAQSYLFHHHQVPAPSTLVSFDCNDALSYLAASQPPYVFKKSYGAASQNVHLVPSRSHAVRILHGIFCQQMWETAKRDHASLPRRLLAGFGRRWFWSKVWQKLTHAERYGVACWQEFIAGNLGDLRITVIGDQCAFAFWRRNRPGDFRASGSGRIDYESPVPEATLKYCLGLSRRLGFDSMAYDLLFQDNRFVLTEMSYAFVDTAIYDTPGHYELAGDDLVYLPGHVWPQQKWVDWALGQMSADVRRLRDV